MTTFYTYAYLREGGTPYYIGKGSGGRCYRKGGRPCGIPSDPSRIIFLKRGLTEGEAFLHESYMIYVFGRKDLGTGILLNKTNGGEGPSGRIVSVETKIKISKSRSGKGKFGRICTPETRMKLRESNKGKKRSEETRRKIKESKSVISQATRSKISQSLKGNKLSEETKKKISENHGSKKPETRQKLKEATSGKKHWVNKEGERKFQHESPGSEWQNGRKWRNLSVSN